MSSSQPASAANALGDFLKSWSHAKEVLGGALKGAEKGMRGTLSALYLLKGTWEVLRAGNPKAAAEHEGRLMSWVANDVNKYLADFIGTYDADLARNHAEHEVRKYLREEKGYLSERELERLTILATVATYKEGNPFFGKSDLHEAEIRYWETQADYFGALADKAPQSTIDSLAEDADKAATRFKSLKRR